MRRYLAIDIGASSGRHIVGWRDGDKIKTDEVFRFPNGPLRRGDALVWDIDGLLSNVKAGIAAAREKYPDIVSLSADTWGVDYVLMAGDEPIPPAYAYRDTRTTAVIDEVHARVPFPELYARTGTQFQSFNTLYQLFADLRAGRLERATGFLMLPEYLMFRLCGARAQEYTNATTTGLVSAASGEYDTELISRLGLPEHLFGPLSAPGTALGDYEGIRVTLCATHDTASAVEGIPMAQDAPYISSGTWSLLGVKTPRPITDARSRAGNWSNEGGVGYNRYQKNIMGMWLVNRLRDELCPGTPFAEVVRMAQESACAALIDANDASLLAPDSMAAAFAALAPGLLHAPGDYFQCAFRSLASGYAAALAELETNTGRSYNSLYIVGGGAKNGYLNRLTAEASGKRVEALPIEATALGNLKIQMEADK